VVSQIYQRGFVGILAIVTIALLAKVLLLSPLWPSLGFLASAVIIAALLFSVTYGSLVNGRILLLVLSVSILAWTITVDSNQVSDFGVYFRCGTEYTSPWNSIQAWAGRCESSWLPGFASYWRRSLLYSLPIGWLSSGTYLGFKLANSGLHVAAIALLYRGVNASFGHAAGLFSATLLVIYPEFWFAATIVCSDNLVVVILIAFILALAKLIDNQSSTKSILAVTVLLVVLDLIRSIGPILVIAIFLLLPLVSEYGCRIRLIKIAILSSVSISVLGFAPSLLGMTTIQTNGLLETLVGGGLTHSRSFQEAYAWHQYVLPLIDPDKREMLLTGLLAQDLTEAFSLPSFWMQKIGALFEGGGYYFFATSGPLGSPDDFILTDRISTVTYNTNWAGVMRGVVAFCCMAACAGAIKMKKHALGQAALTVIAAFLLFIIIFGEVQARYSLLFAPALCIAAAGIFIKRDIKIYPAFIELSKCMGVVFIGMILCILTARIWASKYLAESPTIFWTQSSILESNCRVSKALNIELRRIILPLQGDTCYSLNAVTQNLGGNIQFYAARDPVPPRWSRELLQSIELEVVVHHLTGPTTTVHGQLTSRKIIIPLLIKSDSGIVSFDFLFSTSGKANGNLILGYFSDDKSIISNLSKKHD
jgi:hypothetical protein